MGTKDCDGSEDTHCNCYTNYYVPNSNCSECEGDYQKIFDICEGKNKHFFGHVGILLLQIFHEQLQISIN